MDLTSKRNIKKLFKEHRVQPSKRLGQNFLIDKAVIKKIIKEARLKTKDIVLEIGPGIGTLTQDLSKEAKKLIAVEKDLKMYDILKELLECWNVKNVELVKEDILKFNPLTYKLKAKSYKVVANLPFYLTAPAIRKFLETKFPPELMILVVQKEVAQRICACPPKMNILAVSVQFYAKPEIISYVSKKSFWPSPKVDSAIIKIQNIISASHQRRKSVFNQRFFRIVKAGFSQPRKQLTNNLSKKLELNKERVKFWLLENNIQPTQRAETLSIEDWVCLVENFKNS